MERGELAKRIYDISNIKGTFTLRSGRVSHEYFDKYLFESDPEILGAIGEHMAVLIPRGCDGLAGLEMGGIPIVTVLSRISGLPAFFVRKAAKKYGTCKLAEGGDIKGRIVVVEDVVTSGGQIIDSTRALRGLGAVVTEVLCVIDRENGGRENLAAEGLILYPLFTMSELKRWGISSSHGSVVC